MFMRSIKDKINPVVKIPEVDFMTRNSSSFELMGEEPKRYASAMAAMPELWRFSSTNYKGDPKFYNHNSDGFRNDIEFDTVDWDNTCAIVGCSFVYGQAIEKYNTISSILTSEYNLPTMNLGVPGASNRRIHNNAIQVIKKYKPKKVIILWSYPNRNTWTYDYNEWDGWTHEDIHNAGLIKDRAEKKELQFKKFVPNDYIESDYCCNTLYDYQLYKDVHDILGTVQYHVNDKNKGPMQEAEWIKPNDITYYQMRHDIECGELKLDYNNPKHMKYINDFYARDMFINNDGSVSLAHYGRSINRDIADLIYRENFK